MNLVRLSYKHSNDQLGLAGLAVTVKVVYVTGLGQSEAVQLASRSLSCHCLALSSVIAKQLYNQRCNGRLVFITRLLSMSQIRALLRAFYTLRYFEDANERRIFTFEKFSVALPYTGDDVM